MMVRMVFLPALHQELPILCAAVYVLSHLWRSWFLGSSLAFHDAFYGFYSDSTLLDGPIVRSRRKCKVDVMQHSTPPHLDMRSSSSKNHEDICDIWMFVSYFSICSSTTLANTIFLYRCRINFLRKIKLFKCSQTPYAPWWLLTITRSQILVSKDSSSILGY